MERNEEDEEDEIVSYLEPILDVPGDEDLVDDSLVYPVTCSPLKERALLFNNEQEEEDDVVLSYPRKHIRIRSPSSSLVRNLELIDLTSPTPPRPRMQLEGVVI